MMNLDKDYLIKTPKYDILLIHLNFIYPYNLYIYRL